MEKEQVSHGQPELAISDDAPLNIEETHELKERAQSVIELSRELTSSSKALLEQIEPSV